ncbi:recombinase family protein [Pseudarthrobacter sp. HLT3-5]|uniref:recombinase family protein n=1 Tax=Pseudarthrobacter cellobiosi TaxID=2953654 RepID=UPI00208E6CA5|nr:recombinase family protein [Pseudarthrobacter sp. HLT3-5]MCO4274249.1 recombinase family protein [Pseudarthrobacter sp. HLT3-5]
MRFAIYGRISRDRVGAGLGVERQVTDCRDLVSGLKGEVVAIFRDDDISAYSGKHRPGYESLLQAIKNGDVDAVAVWHQDRLLRRTIDLENYIEVCQPLNVATYTVKAGQLDLTTPAGRAVAKTLAAWASYEVETSTDRVKAAKLQAARAGKPSGGNRAYGYEQNGMVIIERECAVVRESIERFIAGHSWNEIALDFNARSIPTAKGNKWSAINVRNVAVRPRNISIRVHNDSEYPAQWPALVSQDTWDDLQLAIMKGQAIYGKRSYARKHLLSGFVFCGLCDSRMKIINAQQRDGSYSPAFSCRKKDHRGQVVGCGKVKRKKDPVEDLIVDCIMYRLDTPDLAALLASSKNDTTELKALMRDHETQSLRLQEILNLYSTGDITFDEYKIAKVAAAARLQALGRELDQKSTRNTLGQVPAGQSVREAWDRADLAWRRQLVDTLIDKILIHPKQLGDGKARYKQWIFNPDRVEIRWTS